MKKYLFATILVLLCIQSPGKTYPYQDPKLPEDTRIRNLISLMNIGEKLSFPYYRILVSRPGIKGTIIGELKFN
ncbi:MAG: hypothetical protein MUE32_10275 [Bacteroidales bacterium]|nr:hypothetical protein [Bacteroidales bacterium]